jgi:hypothetical protein
MSSTKPDILIHDATVLTVDENNHLYRNGTVVVDEGTVREVRQSEMFISLRYCCTNCLVRLLLINGYRCC